MNIKFDSPQVQKPVLTYKDLKPGDLFRFTMIVDSVVLKMNMGHLFLANTNGSFYEQILSNCSDWEVIRLSHTLIIHGGE